MHFQGNPALTRNPSSELTDEEIRNAQLAVARNSKNARDLGILLDMLGLLPKKEDDPVDYKEQIRLKNERLRITRRKTREEKLKEEILWLTQNDY